MRKSIAALVLLLVAGCSGGSYVEWDRTTTGTMELKQSIDGKPVGLVQIRTEGKDTLLDFNGHAYVFRNRTGHSGRITFDEARLTIDDLNVRVDRSGIHVRGASFTIDAEHLSDDRRRILEGMSFLIE